MNRVLDSQIFWTAVVVIGVPLGFGALALGAGWWIDWWMGWPLWGHLVYPAIFVALYVVGLAWYLIGRFLPRHR